MRQREILAVQRTLIVDDRVSDHLAAEGRKGDSFLFPVFQHRPHQGRGRNLMQVSLMMPDHDLISAVLLDDRVDLRLILMKQQLQAVFIALQDHIDEFILIITL